MMRDFLLIAFGMIGGAALTIAAVLLQPARRNTRDQEIGRGDIGVE